MEDRRIIGLFWQRDTEAITEAAHKYGAYCASIARNLLESSEDAEECVNDTWLRAWNAIPPQRPRNLAVFLGTITRNLAVNRCRDLQAQKRGGRLGEMLGELSQCAVPSAEQIMDQKELTEALNSFLQKLPRKKRSLFACRYWFGDSIEDIAANFHTTPGAVTMQLKRMREKLRAHLEERGITL